MSASGDASDRWLTVLDGSTFFASDRAGDVERADAATGFFFEDTRHISTWRLLADGRPISVLTSRPIRYYSARVYGTLASVGIGRNPSLIIRRDRLIADGVHEDVVVDNNREEEQRVRLELLFDADFADLFEVKEDRVPGRHVDREVSDGRVILRYKNEGFSRTTSIAFSQPGLIQPARAVFDLALAARQRWELCVHVTLGTDDGEVPTRAHHGSFEAVQPNLPRTLDEWLADAPRLETPFDALRHTYQQSLLDLAALRIRPTENVTWSLPAAGLPWFMAIFGRDSLITSYQALPFEQQLARTTLEALAAMQAREFDDFRDAEPGKILHELRCGERTRRGESPHSPYYGTHDATPLFLILLDEYERWTGDLALVRRLEPHARAALEWIERHGDLDGDGYLEYRTRSPQGLVNQSWKDSWNSMLFADGRLAAPPIATCEIQGYAYDARLRCARMARLAWQDEALAGRLEASAAQLRARFNRDFWSAERGHFVLALDGDKRQVDAMTSNAGHLLWSGIADPELAAITARRLLAEDMFSGWGVRTMSARDGGYNPIEYHNGTVWPHDTSLVAEGLRRYGFRAQAARLAVALIEAAEHFAYRLPEVFAGMPRAESTVPVEYPTPSRPQAWSAAAPMLVLRTVMGMDPDGELLRVDPFLPHQLRGTGLTGVPFRGARVDT